MLEFFFTMDHPSITPPTGISSREVSETPIARRLIRELSTPPTREATTENIRDFYARLEELIPNKSKYSEIFRCYNEFSKFSYLLRES